MNSIIDCPTCNYPVSASHAGQTLNCPMCDSVLEITQGEVTVPAPLITFLVGLAVGIIAGPAIYASAKGGSAYLERKASERIK